MQFNNNIHIRSKTVAWNRQTTMSESWTAINRCKYYWMIPNYARKTGSTNITDNIPQWKQNPLRSQTNIINLRIVTSDCIIETHKSTNLGIKLFLKVWNQAITGLLQCLPPHWHYLQVNSLCSIETLTRWKVSKRGSKTWPSNSMLRHWVKHSYRDRQTSN